MKEKRSRAKTKKYIYIGLIAVFSVAFLVSTGFLADYFIKSWKHQKMSATLSEMVQPENNGTDSLEDYTHIDLSEDFTLPPTSRFTRVVHPKTGRAMIILSEYASLFAENPDLVGWITIDGTQVNYPVLQTPEWVNYYLTRDFYGQYSKHGSLYVNESANVKTPSDNVTIYGHKMKDGSMFASLHEYKSKTFFAEHPYIKFSTIYEHHTYQIVSVFTTTANVETGFAYHNFVDGNKESFDAFVAKCKELSLYNTGVDAAYGDKLITLSTCEHSIVDGRFVVVAKRIS